MGKLRRNAMEPAQEDLFDKVKIIASGPNRNLLRHFVDFLYEREEETFSSEDLAAIEEGLAQIKRGETISWDELKKELRW
jgi:predicted transcriptional regulator